jgi:hypothetical protein
VNCLPCSFPVDRVEYPLEARFANGIELLGYSLPLDAISCTQRTLPLTLFLRQPTSGSTDETVLFAHLMLPEGQLQDNELPGDGYPSSFWRPGETVDDRRSFALPQPLTSGKAISRRASSSSSPTAAWSGCSGFDSRGNPAGDQLVFGPLAVCEGPPPASLDDLVPLRARFEERIELAGLQVAPLSESASALQITLGWRALDRSPSDYTAFVHLLDANGTLVSQLDSPPGGASNPTDTLGPWRTAPFHLRCCRCQPGSTALPCKKATSCGLGSTNLSAAASWRSWSNQRARPRFCCCPWANFCHDACASQRL